MRGGEKINKTNILRKVIGILIIIFFIFNILQFKSLASESLASSEESLEEEIITEKESILDVDWQEIDDERLNEAIANSDEDDLSNFLQGLTEEELEEIIKRDTMLKNEIKIYNLEDTEEGCSTLEVESTQIYYQYLLGLNTTTKYTRASTTYTTKKGYFFIQISGDGKTTKRRISVTLTSTNRLSQQTVTYSEVAVSGYSDNHKFTLVAANGKTQISDSYYDILVLQFSYTKSAHYYAKSSYSDKVSGYRFNFKTYPNMGDSPSSVNNTGHNIVDTTEIIDVQINVINCGIATSSSSTTSHATGYINLSKGYYGGLSIDPNGGTHNGNTSVYTYGIECCETETEVIEEPTRDGYIFTGWTLIKGDNCSGADFNFETSVFTFCGNSTSSSKVSSANTCILKANWTEAYYDLPDTGKFPLDNIFVICGIFLIIFIVIIC